MEPGTPARLSVRLSGSLRGTSPFFPFATMVCAGVLGVACSQDDGPSAKDAGGNDGTSAGVDTSPGGGTGGTPGSGGGSTVPGGGTGGSLGSDASLPGADAGVVGAGNDGADGPEPSSGLKCSAADRQELFEYLLASQHRSYRAPRGYFKTGNTVDEIIERLLVGEDGFDEAGAVNLYDDATYQIAAALLERHEAAEAVTTLLRSGQSGELSKIRAATADGYSYNGRALDVTNGWFFRTRAMRYLMRDPLDGKASFPGFPESDALHFVDWKPVAGENAWVIIGALQAEYLRNCGGVTLDAPAVQLALSLLPAFEAMQSPIGGIYHAPAGTSGKDPRDISVENNASALAALRMLRTALQAYPNQPPADTALATIERIITGRKDGRKVGLGLYDFFRDYAFNREDGVFWQGGMLDTDRGVFTPTRTFAVDTQTWPVIVLGPEWIVRNLGGGDPAFVLRIWERLKERAGYPDANNAIGVGFTDGHEILSSEWSFGAILTAIEMVRYYERVGAASPGSDLLAEKLWQEATAWWQALEQKLRVSPVAGQSAYLYSNLRYSVPFGWWANPIPAKAPSAWALLLDCRNLRDSFNPFILGGEGIVPDDDPGREPLPDAGAGSAGGDADARNGGRSPEVPAAF